MKSFEVEVRRTSFITLWVNADTKEQAETLAWAQIDDDNYTDHATWDIEYVEEVSK